MAIIHIILHRLVSSNPDIFAVSVDVQFPVHLNDPPSLPQLAFDGDSPRMTAVTMSLALGWTMLWTRKPGFHVMVPLS